MNIANKYLGRLPVDICGRGHSYHQEVIDRLPAPRKRAVDEEE